MRCKLAVRIAGTVLATAGTVAGLTMPATATTTTDVTAAIAPAAGLLDAMQRDLGLTAEQAQLRLAQEAVANRADQLLRGTLADTFGGSFFDTTTGKLTVGVTDTARIAQVEAAGAQARLVTFTTQQLNSIVNGLNARDATLPKQVTGWYVDEASNSVVLTTQPGSRAVADSFVREAGVRAEAVRVTESPEQPKTLADVIGGNAFYIGDGARCSVGFGVLGGFVTAGHCGTTGATTSQPTGTFEGSSFPGNDYAYVAVGSADTPQPLVNHYDGSNIGVAGSTESAVGASVCRSGSTSGWHCGTVEAKNQTVQYAEGTVNGLTRTTVCAEPGDSGGSYLSGNQAQGTTSGGSGDCTAGGTTYFQPVNEVLSAYGLTLLTQ